MEGVRVIGTAGRLKYCKCELLRWGFILLLLCIGLISAFKWCSRLCVYKVIILYCGVKVVCKIANAYAEYKALHGTIKVDKITLVGDNCIAYINGYPFGFHRSMEDRSWMLDVCTCGWEFDVDTDMFKQEVTSG